MEIIELRDSDQLEECTEVQEKVWGIGKQDILPTHFMKAYVAPEEPWGNSIGRLRK